MGFDGLVRKAGYPGSKMIPADAAMLGLLALKLLRKERLSHIDDYNVDEGLGLFAGLNVLPKNRLPPTTPIVHNASSRKSCWGRG